MYKVLENRENVPAFIFHGIPKDNSGQSEHHQQRTRNIKTNRWLKAEKKQVTDGTKGTFYVSGFHVFVSLFDVKRWRTSVSGPKNKNRYVVKVKTKILRYKAHSKYSVFLADEIMIRRTDWQNKTPLLEL